MVKEIKLISTKIINQDTPVRDIVDLILKNRVIKNIDEFLKPSFPQFKLNLSPTIKLIKSAIKNNHNILIYGDYDVDGITATAILWQTLHKLYPNVTPFIPHREIDGYGIKAKSFFRFQTEKNIKFELLITVDNGIVAETELAKIKAKQDIQIIVTDHHLSDKKLSSADSIIASTEICGAAISYFLSQDLDKDADIGLAALGTVADCLPLVGINRSLVVHGLKKLSKDPSPGLKTLINIAKINPAAISAYDLGFVLGPRINAVGRLSDPTDALRLLCSSTTVQASKYAFVLNDFNQDRQTIQKESLDIADKNIDTTNKIIVISGGYNPGIIGLISGRLTEKYYLPSVVISVDGDVAKGSCRSIPELNIINALREHSDLFIDLGGHSGAAGFSILTKNIPKLKKALIKSVNLKLDKTSLSPHIDVDCEMQIRAVTLKNIKSLEDLAPFGIGNPEPLFLFKHVIVNSIRTIGQNNDHLKLKINNLDAVAFKKGELINKLKVGGSVDLVASLSENIWNNTSTPQLIVKEIITV